MTETSPKSASPPSNAFLNAAARIFPLIRHSLLIALLLSTSALAQTNPQLLPLPDKLTIAGKSYAIVPAHAATDESSWKPPKAFRFEDKQPTDLLDESLRYWLGSASFLRAPGGRIALPYRGEAPFVGYVDLEKKAFVTYKDAFPPTGEKPNEGGPTRYNWVTLLDEAPQPTGLWLFVSRWNREARQWASWRARISFDAPQRIETADMNGVAVLELLARNGNEFIACIDDGPDRTWARISTDTWKVLAKGKPAKEYGHLGRTAYSPDKSEVYAVYSSGGLVIFNAKDGAEKAHLGVGNYVNASTLGATFDPSGSVAVVATPYAKEITLVDVKTRQILARYKTTAPLAGIVFDAGNSTAGVVQTFLPYE